MAFQTAFIDQRQWNVTQVIDEPIEVLIYRFDQFVFVRGDSHTFLPCRKNPEPCDSSTLLRWRFHRDRATLNRHQQSYRGECPARPDVRSLKTSERHHPQLPVGAQ